MVSSSYRKPLSPGSLGNGKKTRAFTFMHIHIPCTTHPSTQMFPPRVAHRMKKEKQVKKTTLQNLSNSKNTAKKNSRKMLNGHLPGTKMISADEMRQVCWEETGSSNQDPQLSPASLQKPGESIGQVPMATSWRARHP